MHRAFVARVPYEALAVQLQEFAPLDARALVARVLRGGRGGYCFEINTVLLTLLESCGFEVERRAAVVGARDAWACGEPVNHLTLVVQTPDGGPFIADAGLGEGVLDPLPLAAGRVFSDAFCLTIERDGDGWWVGQHEFGSVPGFRFGDARQPLSAFGAHHERLSTSPESSFVQTLVVQRPAADRIVTLRARTLFSDGPGRRERTVLDGPQAFCAVLEDSFGIAPDVLGPARLARLWGNACEQHRAHQLGGEDAA
ncbi:MAG TPA: arylamine N-acetyltransferase [Solirubrobacteraceae bacterium]|nr:arylamine N-acetyltransferase [Solirubrobacteraceae bacterium]